MRTLRATLVTVRMHRFEVLFAVVLFALTAVSAAIATSSAEAATPSLSCQEEWYETAAWWDKISRECRGELRDFFRAAGAGTVIWEPIAVAVPWLVGIVLGVPLVGRELETGSASLAWSLSARRGRWLLARVLPMLLLLLVGAAVVGFLLGRMAGAMEPVNQFFGPGRLPELGDIGREGLPFVLRSFAAFGVGLLAGAVVGRMTAAVVVATALSLGLYLAFDYGVPAVVSEQVAIWGPPPDEDHGYNLRYLGRGGTEDGTILSEAQIDALWDTEVCPGCGTDFGYDATSEELGQRYREWVSSRFRPVFRTVPTEAYPEFERAETIVGFVVASGALLLTFPVVSRRRPR